MSTMTVESLIAGYETYATPSDLIMSEYDAAPAVSPTPSIWTFVTASSPECLAFSLGATGASVGTTFAAGC